MSHSLCALVGLLISYLTVSPLGIRTTLIQGGRPGLYNIWCLSSDFFLYWGLCVPRHQKHLLYAELLQEDFRILFSPTSHCLVSQVYSASVVQLSKYFAHWCDLSHAVPGCEEDPSGIRHSGASLREPTVELGLCEGWTWVPLSLLVWRGGRGAGLGAQGPGQLLPSPLMGCVVLGKLSTLPKLQFPLPIGCRPQRKFH